MRLQSFLELVRVVEREVAERRRLVGGLRDGAVVGVALVGRERVPCHHDVGLDLADDAHEVAAQLRDGPLLAQLTVGVAETDHLVDAEQLGCCVDLLVAGGAQLVGGQLERALVVVGRDDERDLVAAVGELRDRAAGRELHVVAVGGEDEYLLLGWAQDMTSFTRSIAACFAMASASGARNETPGS